MNKVYIGIVWFLFWLPGAQATPLVQSHPALLERDFYSRPSPKKKTFGLNYFKPVILGILYRGGSAGTRKANDNDSGVLTQNQLMALCQVGFSKVVYAYGNSKYLIPTTHCVKPNGRPNVLSYEGVSYSDKNRFIEIIDDVIRNNRGPIYDHCWNGWHASGELAAVALKQFCDFSDSEAQKYWQKNRYDKVAVPSLLKRIASYRSVSGLSTLNSAEQLERCPHKPN